MEEFLKIGLIQTTLDSDLAWDNRADSSVQICSSEGNRVWNEIQKGFYNFSNETKENRPQIIILPELTIPQQKEKSLINLSKKVGAITIAGLDFIDHTKSQIANKAILIVPCDWPNARGSGPPKTLTFGKTFYSYMEKKFFNLKGKHEYSFPIMYILDAGEYGKIGVAICSDFFDIERFVVYRGQIHHMLVISYNQDVKSYYFLAEAISRLVYCNVIICNTGFYGGSIVFSPYKDEFRRYIYKHEGSNLFTTQIVSLPVRSLDDAQKPGKFEDDIFKAQPPGYKHAHLLRSTITKSL
jgi:predicted amidohydrolase